MIGSLRTIAPIDPEEDSEREFDYKQISISY